MALTALTGAASAIPFEDPAIGLKVDPPAPFFVIPAKSKTYADVVGIGSTTGSPPVGRGNPFLCEIGYVPVTAYAGMTQPQLNNLANDPEWVERAASALQTHYAISSKAFFSLDNAIGAELVGTPKTASDGGTAVFVSIVDTPAGRTTLNCATPAEAMTSALAQFRKLRDGITLPTRPAAPASH